MTKKLMERENIKYDVIDVTQDPTALDTIKQLGYLQAPVVVAGDKHWSGFQPEEIKSLVA